MRHPVFGIHTGIFKHQITKKECHAVKAFFGKQPDETLSEEMFFFDKGVTKIWLQEISGRYAKYYLYVKINFSRVLGISGHKVMPYTIPNVKKAIKAVDRVLKKLPLLEKNSDFSDWTAERIDTAFDVYEEYPKVLMWLLNHALNLGNGAKKCKRIPVCADGKTPEQIMCESARFGNNSYVYNVYAKLPEVIAKARAKGTTAAPEDLTEVQNLVRIERQNLENGCKKLLPDGKAGDLTKASVREDILKTMIDEMALFFGKNDFFSWDGIQKKYFPEHEAEIKAVLGVMVQITKTSLEESQETFTKEAAGTFERLGLAPVGIPPGKHSIDSIQGVYTRILSEYPRPPNKRPYSDFPKPHKTGDGRYKATVTLYQADGTRKQLSVAGRSVADYEQKVLAKLTDVYLRNRVYTAKNSGTARPDCCRKSADSLIRFHKAAKTQSVKKDAEQFIKALKLDIKNPEVHNINGLPSGINSSGAVADKPAQLLNSNVRAVNTELLQQKINLSGGKKMYNEIKEVLEMKGTVLEMKEEVYSRLCVLSKENKKIDVSFEKELIQNAASALSDENSADSREDCLKILTAYYLAVGIGLDSCGAPVNNLTESGLLKLREEAAEV